MGASREIGLVRPGETVLAVDWHRRQLFFERPTTA
jgi:hypothetical protein